MANSSGGKIEVFYIFLPAAEIAKFFNLSFLTAYKNFRDSLSQLTDGPEFLAVHLFFSSNFFAVLAIILAFSPGCEMAERSGTIRLRQNTRFGRKGSHQLSQKISWCHRTNANEHAKMTDTENYFFHKCTYSKNKSIFLLGFCLTSL